MPRKTENRASSENRYEDYPVYVTADQNVRKLLPKYQLSAGNMQKVMEV